MAHGAAFCLRDESTAPVALAFACDRAPASPRWRAQCVTATVAWQGARAAPAGCCRSCGLRAALTPPSPRPPPL